MITFRNTLPLMLTAATLISCSSGTSTTSNLSFFAMATADSYKSEKFMPFMATDGEADASGWESEPGGLSTWLQLEFPHPTQASGAIIYWGPMTSEGNTYSLEYSKGGKAWRQVPGTRYSRKNIMARGLDMLRDSISFRPVKASKYRIRIEAGNDSTGFGSVREFELMGDLQQFDTLESVRRVLNCEVPACDTLKLINNASGPWHLDLPQPEAGLIADGVYFSAPGLESDADFSTRFCSQMQIVSDCSAEDFHSYIGKLAAAGYKPLEERRMEKNIHVQLKGQEKTVYAYYTDSEHYMRVICDKSPVTQDDFSYQAASNGNAGIYQFALNYAGNTHNTMDCGMLYALLPGDGSVMMMDGSHIFQTSEEFYGGVYDFLREITGTPEGEKVRISCWFITHSHSDHLAGASGFLRRYHDKVDLERVMFNFPASAVKPAETAYASQLRHTLRTYYPDVTYLKPHTGMHLDLAAMGIDVMYTHEDAVNAENPANYPLRDFNCTSTVLKVTMGGCSAILFGDTNVEAEKIITRNYSPESWKADMVQISHHCFNYLTTLYGWCHAPLIVVPNSVENTHTEKNLPKLQDALQYATDGAYYEGDDTYGFRPTDKGFVLCYQKPRIGKPGYDGTGN